MSKLKRFLRGSAALVIVVALVLQGCAATMSGGEQTSIRFIAVHKTLPPLQQQADRRDCLALAQARAGDPVAQGVESGAKTALLTALIATAFGAAAGAIGGHAGTGAAIGAVTGGAAGIGGGVVAQSQRRDVAVNRFYAECLLEKGYDLRPI